MEKVKCRTQCWQNKTMESPGSIHSSPLINFFHPVLQPSISCSTLGAEDYPVENLISSDFYKSNRGFIVYLSKPPISLDINLMCPIELTSIKIWPEIGSLKSTGFDIFTKLNGRTEKIASCDNLNENSVVFCRLKDLSELSAAHVKKCFFFRNLKEYTKVDRFTLRIWKTRNSSAPAIKKIEVWGKVANKCPLNERVLKLWSSRDGGCNNSTQSVPLHSNKASNGPLQSDDTSNEIQIPDELLDAITHHIMTVPMTLPSGKTVDQSTLEKFNKIEATWGREPSDPFTGMTFTDNRRPIFNPALKSGADKLLNKHPNALEFSNVPRTIGTVSGNGKRIPASTEITSSDSTKRFKYFESSLNGIDVSESTKYLFRATDKEANKIACYKCQSIEELYRIKICEKDFICRCCLFKIDFSKCNGQCRCSRPFSQRDVEKYYSSSKAFNYHLS